MIILISFPSQHFIVCCFSAGSAVDYVDLSAILTFNNSVQMICSLLTTNDDNIYEFDETLNVELDSGDVQVVFSTNFATVTIMDNDEG